MLQKDLLVKYGMLMTMASTQIHYHHVPVILIRWAVMTDIQKKILFNFCSTEKCSKNLKLAAATDKLVWGNICLYVFSMSIYITDHLAIVNNVAMIVMETY